MQKYRNNGAIGALLDEYEKVIMELETVISKITKQELATIVDHNTEDLDCKSIQTILTHVIKAGYNYVNEIRRSLGEPLEFMSPKTLHSVEEYTVELRYMFQYNVQLFKDYPELKLEEYNLENKILVRWGQQYDAEQLLEHAIVHILRHRRQIERFLIQLRS
jgi:uncharacterized damage-inducible protein DinB